MDYFIYKGIDSRSMGVYIARRGNSPLVFNSSPPSRVISEKIAGKHGTVVIEHLYEPREIEISLYMTDTSLTTIKQISRWLGSVGTYELFLSTEPYKKYYATVEQQLNPILYNAKQAVTDLVFTCYNPFGYSTFSTSELGAGVEYNTGLLYNSGIFYVGSGIEYSFVGGDLPNLDIFHGGNTDYATPKITIVGSGTDITIGRYSDVARTALVEECTYGAFSGTLVLDSKLTEIYLNGAVNNATFDGDYFTLDGVDNATRISQGICQSVSNSQVVLQADESTVNDFYNGKALCLYNLITGEMSYNSILDYVGATKTVSMPTNKTINGSQQYGYFILDFAQILNYFKITGTGLSITSIDFDFEFVYL